MKQKLNYEAKAVCNNGAISHFDFHGDNAALATDHIQHVANAGIDAMSFDLTPDKLHHITYRHKANVKWKCVFPIAHETATQIN